MRDRPLIIGGLIFFLGLTTFPVWHNLSVGTTPKGPEPKLPAEEKACVAEKGYIRPSHMDLLTDWREQVVRQGEREFVAFDGKTHTISLSQTCMTCHGNREDFCDRCHAYAGVQPYCWDCHIDPKLAQRSQR
jgi:hypothetical protein